MRWLERILSPEKTTPLQGTPLTRRQKNYAAESGYAYEYFYDGFRDVAGVREHWFNVSGDRKQWFQTAVRVPDVAVRAWEIAHDRALAANERYAIAKMALFQAFDARETPDGLREPVLVEAGQVQELLGRLGIE
jgi:hypothetical protein